MYLRMAISAKADKVGWTVQKFRSAYSFQFTMVYVIRGSCTSYAFPFITSQDKFPDFPVQLLPASHTGTSDLRVNSTAIRTPPSNQPKSVPELHDHKYPHDYKQQ